MPFSPSGPAKSIGMKLDAQVGTNELTRPAGAQGIHDQLYRAVGCIRGQRGGGGDGDMQRYIFNRIVFELTDVDDLMNDDDVTVTTYRGLDPLLNSADGKTFLAGETQRVDERWG